MATPFRLKRSAVANKRPALTDLAKGELALNTYDGNLYTEQDTVGVGIGTTVTLLTPWQEQFGKDEIQYTGVVSATTYHGDQIVGTPTVGSFRAGAMGSPAVDDKTKDHVEEINYILGKLVPAAPDTLDSVSLTIEVDYGGTYNGQAVLCAGFTPTNNTGGAAPSAGTVYLRNTDSTISSGTLTDYGPGDSGTLTGYVNATGIGTTTFNTSFGLYAAGLNSDVTSDTIRITNNTDASDSARNTGITSLFYEVFDVEFLNSPSPNGYNKAYITHAGKTTAESFWYEDPSTVGAPDMTFGSVTPPSSPTLAYSSGIPHYTQAAGNAFSYQISVENVTGDMYYWTHNRVLWAESQTTGFTRPDQYKLFDELFVSGTQGTIPPQRNFGVGTAATCTATHVPRDIHATITTNHFHRWDCWTPYGNDQNERVTYTDGVNIMGTTARTDEVDEDNIGITGSLGTGSGNATRVPSLSLNDTPSYSGANYSWTGGGNVTLAAYESIVRGADLRHDRENYSTGWAPAGPNLSGRSNSDAQYFTFQFIRSAVSEFNIVVTGTYGGCWVNMPDNSSWTTGLSNTNGWANMFAAYSGSGVPNNANSGCSDGGAMGGTSGTFKCVFGTESSTNDSNNRILVRIKMDSGDAISALSIAAT